MFESFFARNTKENYEPLNLVSVHYRNKALIKDIGVNSFNTYCKQYFIVLLSILIKLLRTEMSEIHSDESIWKNLTKNAWHHNNIVCMIASANFTVQKQKVISQCRIQRDGVNIPFRNYYEYWAK